MGPRPRAPRGSRSASPSSSRTAAPGTCRQVERWVHPRVVDGREIGEATFELPGDLPDRAGTASSRTSTRRRSPRGTDSATLVVTPQRLELPEVAAPRRRHRADDADLPGALGRVVGRRRPRRPRRARVVGGDRPRGRVRPRQPAPRGRAGRPDGGLALPADDPPLRQPALPARRGHPRGRAPRRDRPGARRGARRLGPRAQHRRHDRP